MTQRVFVFLEFTIEKKHMTLQKVIPQWVIPQWVIAQWVIPQWVIPMVSGRGTTGNLALAGSGAQSMITCSHSLTKRSIAIGGCGGVGYTATIWKEPSIAGGYLPTYLPPILPTYLLINLPNLEAGAGVR